MARLNSYDDWSNLTEIIVGSAENYTSHDRELSFDVFYHENLFRSDWAYPRLSAASDVSDRSWQIKQRYVEELNTDVENLATQLESLGVTVHRPVRLPPSAQSIKVSAGKRCLFRRSIFATTRLFWVTRSSKPLRRFDLGT